MNTYSATKDDLEHVAKLSRKVSDDAITTAACFQYQLRTEGLNDLATQFNSVFYKAYRAGCLASPEIALRALST